MNEHIMAALVGSAGSGMTTLVEGVLHRAGVIARPGTIAGGNTVGDYQPEEVARSTTLAPALTFLQWDADNGSHYEMTLADTPGHPDFIGGVDSCLSAADVAIVVVNAANGVNAGTRAAWDAVDHAGIPRIVVVTGADRPQADFLAVVDQLRAAYPDAHLLPVSMPIGKEEDFRAIADVIGMRQLARGADGKRQVAKVPDDVFEAAQAMHEQATEEIVSRYDELMEAYLEGNEPTYEELEEKLAEQVAEGGAIPILVASGVTENGVARLLDTLCRLADPLSKQDATVFGPDGTEIKVARDPKGEPLVHIFDVVADPFLGQVSMLKVLSGSIKTGDRLRNATTGSDERLGNLFRMRGVERIPVDKLEAGEVGGVAKLADAPAGSLLWGKSSGKITPKPLPERPPVYSVVLEPATQADTEKLSTALTRAVSEDQTLVIDRTGGLTIVRGLGNTHVEVLVDRLKRIFGVNVNTSPAPVAYLETIAKPIEAEGKIKKQSGGSGQFAVVNLKVKPLPPGGGFEFIDSVVGGTVPRQYIPAVEKGARDAVEKGGPAGFPVVDISVELYFGKYHSVDSNEMAFRNAGALGVKEALEKAGTTVLEPISVVEVTVPNDYQGAIMQDLSGRRGRVQDTQMAPNGDAIIIAQVPEAELDRYVLDLRSITQGHARLKMTHSHYEPKPNY